MSNQYNYACPDCGSQDGITVNGSVYVCVRLRPNDDVVENNMSAEELTRDVEWDKYNDAMCDCGWGGTVMELDQVEEEEVSE